MNWLLFYSLIFGACVVVFVASAPADKVNDEKKRDVKPSEMEEIFSDDAKRKRSQEVIMFGNQQNKPAGMVDDVLVGYADKKSYKNQNGEVNDEENDEDDSDNEENKTPGNNLASNGTNGRHFKAEVGPENTDSEETQSIETAEEEEQENPSYLSNNFLPPSTQYDELDEPSGQQLGGELNSYMSQNWNDYGNRFYNSDVYRRRRRNVHHFRKRSLLTPIDKLMNIHHGARWKRDLKIRDDDVVGLLSLLAAAEVAKERQEARQRNLEELEAAYEQSVAVPDDRFESPDEVTLVADNYAYYPVRYDEPVEDINDQIMEEEVVPDFVLREPQAEIELNRRSGRFYPSVDYRALGIIGQKKRNMESSYRNYGLWGRLEERKRMPDSYDLGSLFEGEVDDSDDSDTNDEEDRNDGTDEEKLYSLGQLLKGNEVEDDDRYPVYRRLI